MLANAGRWVFDANLPPLTASGDLRAFTLWRGLTVRYPALVGLVGGALAVVGVVLWLLAARRRLRWVSVAGVVWGLTWRALVVAAAVGAAQTGLSAVGVMPPRHRPFGSNPTMPWLFAVGLVVLLVLVGRLLSTGRGLSLFRRAGLSRRTPSQDQAVGASADERWGAILLMLAVGTVLTSVILPGGSYLLAWPTAALLAVRVLADREPAAAATGFKAGSARLVATVAAAFVVTALFGPMVVLLYQAMNMTAVAAAILFAALPVGPWVLLLSGVEPVRQRPATPAAV